MTDEGVAELINAVFEESFEVEPERLTPDVRIFEDLGLDSLDIVDLVVALQSKFGVRIRDDQRVRSIRTLGDIYEFIDTLNKERCVDHDR